MKINEIIREKRLAEGFTQEQMASYLGVSAPAVNKWEKGVSYPDITLLPALARLLKTDVNTLLSFQEDLSDQEIADFLGSVYTVAMEQGMPQAFASLNEKIREYPSCEKLVLNGALTLEGLVAMTVREGEGELFRAEIERLYERAAEGSDVPVSQHAKAMLVSRYMARKEYAEAERLLEELPSENMFDKNSLKSSLYLAEGKTAEVAQILERMIINDISSVVACLLSLIEVAMKEKREDDVGKLAQTAKDTIRLYDLWEYEEYAIDFQLALVREDAALCLSSLEKMFHAMQKVDDIPLLQGSFLYRHLPVKESPGKDKMTVGEMMMNNLLKEMGSNDNGEYDFLRADSRFQEFLSRWKTEQAAEV